MQGVSWPSLSCEESLERSLERRRSRECSQPPLAPCRLIFLCSTSTRVVRAWLLLFKTEEGWTFLSVSLDQWTVLFYTLWHSHTLLCIQKNNLQIFGTLFICCCCRGAILDCFPISIYYLSISTAKNGKVLRMLQEQSRLIFIWRGYSEGFPETTVS